MTHNSFVIFSFKQYILPSKAAHESADFFDCWVKFRRFPHVIFQSTSLFLSNFASLFTVMRHNFSVLSFAQTSNTFDKNSRSKCKFSDLPLLALKYIKYLISYLKLQVSFFSNFASLSAMRDNSSVLL